MEKKETFKKENDTKLRRNYLRKFWESNKKEKIKMDEGKFQKELTNEEEIKQYCAI